MLAWPHSLGKHSFSNHFLTRTIKGFAIEEAHNFIIRIDIGSPPWFLFGSSDLIIVIISSIQNSKVDSFYSVANFIFSGIEVPLSIVAHC